MNTITFPEYHDEVEREINIDLRHLCHPNKGVTIPGVPAEINPDNFYRPDMNNINKSKTLRKPIANKIRVMVVDDHILVKTAICRMLKDFSEIEIVGEAETGEEAIVVARKTQPDVVLMDIRMPGIGGMEATKKITSTCPNTKVLVVTAAKDHVYPARLFKAGATGYITKDSSIKEVVKAIKSVSSGKKYIANSIAQDLWKEKAEENKTIFDGLSQRELQVATMIIKGMVPKDIAKSLNVDYKTIHSYRYRIYKKFDIKRDVELILLALKYDLVEV